MHDEELKLQRNTPSVLVAPTARAAATSVQTELLPAFSYHAPELSVPATTLARYPRSRMRPWSLPLISRADGEEV
jgi:hypothetical protein